MGDYVLSESDAILTYCQNATWDRDLCDLCIATLRAMVRGDLSRRHSYDLIFICTGACYNDFDLIVAVLRDIRRSNVQLKGGD